MVARQSQTYEQAVQRYVEQYNRQPPPGFQDWFTFAKANNAIIIDDYGQLEQDLAPLRKIPAHVLRQRMKNGRKTGMWELHQWDFKNGTVSTGAKHGTVNAFKGILQPFVHKLPDFSVLQNWDDNHRVCGPKPGEVEDVNDTTVIEVGTSGDPDAMDHLTIGCPRNTETTSSVTSDRPSVDFCKHTHDWMNQHGIFRVHNGCFNSTVPVLSLTKISSFQDITTASWCYGADGYRLWGLNPSGKDSDHVAYRDKRARIYWRGSNTGSRRGKKPHYYGHRERLVMMGAQMQKKAAELAARYKGQSLPGTFTQDDVKRVELPEMPKTFTQLQLSALSRLDPEAIDMNFVGLHGCQNDPERCAEWEKTFPLAAHQDSSFAFRNKFLMDIDGNSMSCRFYRLLDSNSLVFKQTIYVEWHDDRIVPWLHYVPVSKGMEELPILLDYFTNDPTGQALGEMIANTSRDWSNSALRKIDLSVYTYRQMLELAHIIGHD
ncbi:Lipopolysaccharide-modifying protein [Kalmanozyma brasiliensis GHG001]|uniref:Glycosyl transferase CAP10 domain-containing protein n=1 Tax=Kalmanozyma brasiliensis (strain GHG001) TaxID=1365824 RepID=V5ESI2_KALBG|nr:Lipopolysaccharide-modifying protein [Kalmanozyma brasiliensis GHG001]EST08105.1 Lipopolysaccharide-modifying protein [Kalmanozyma brasiliensis GHG001]